jgi:hypothetical protein
VQALEQLRFDRQRMGVRQESRVLAQRVRELILPLGHEFKPVRRSGGVCLRLEQLPGDVEHHPANPGDHFVAEQGIVVVDQQVA